jgi:glycerol uptake facilitator-like aquaporin
LPPGWGDGVITFTHHKEGVTVKAYIAEFIGTFTLVFIGCASVALAPAGVGPIMPALAHGLALMSAIYALGHISGAHVNPAVTVGVAIAGAIEWGKAILYIIAQILGALVAALILSSILPGQAASFGAFSFSATPDRPCCWRPSSPSSWSASCSRRRWQAGRATWPASP